MGSIITSKPKRGRGSIKVDQDHAKRKGAIQALKNVYQKPISTGAKFVGMLGMSTFAAGAALNKALGMDGPIYNPKTDTISKRTMHDMFVKDWGKHIKAIYNVDMWNSKKKEK